jgi:hypothetical protein
LARKHKPPVKLFKSEAELVSATSKFLIADGWNVYFEVAPWGAGAQRADIIATKDDIITVVECKMSLSLSLLDQCDQWRKYANLVWAAVPGGKRNKFAHKIADWLGVGIITVGHKHDPSVHRVALSPRMVRDINTKPISKVLCESQKLTTPGASHGFVTPFKTTCDELIARVRSAGGRILVRNAVNGLKHHYKSTSSARSSLITHVERRIISELRVIQEDGQAYFVLNE